MSEAKYSLLNKIVTGACVVICALSSIIWSIVWSQMSDLELRVRQLEKNEAGYVQKLGNVEATLIEIKVDIRDIKNDIRKN